MSYTSRALSGALDALVSRAAASGFKFPGDGVARIPNEPLDDPMTYVPPRHRISALAVPRHLLGIGLLVALAACLLVASPASALRQRPTTEMDLNPELDHGQLGEGRQAYRERADPQRARKAYEIFQRYHAEQPEDVAGSWHLAMSAYWLGIRVASESEEKKRYYLEGRAAAMAGLANDPECGPCHLMAAINHALWGQEEGIFRTIVGLKTVKHHLRRAEQLDPRFAGAATFRVQAAIYSALPGFLGGGRAKARHALERAIEVAPEEHLNYDFLAQLLIHKYDDRVGALRIVRTGLSVPEPGPAYIESRDALDRLRRAFEQLVGRDR